MRYHDFTTFTRSRLPWWRRPPDAAEIAAVSAAAAAQRAGRRPVRLLGVGGANLVQGDIAQLALFMPE